MFSVSCGKSRAKAVCPSAVREGSCLCERLLFEANSAATLLEFKEKKKRRQRAHLVPGIWDCSQSRVTLSIFTWKPADKNDLKRTSRVCQQAVTLADDTGDGT